MVSAELRSSLEKFAVVARSLHGDENGEAQTFLDHFFLAIGRQVWSGEGAATRKCI